MIIKQIKQIAARIRELPKSFCTITPIPNAKTIRAKGNKTHLLNLSL